MGHRSTTYWAEGLRDFWTEALWPTLRHRWKSLGIWAIALGAGIPYACYGLNKQVALILEDFQQQSPEAQHEILQAAQAFPPPAWITLGVNVAMLFLFLVVLRTAFLPFRRTPVSRKAAFRSEPQAKESL